jgi:hypothetical protein
VSVERGSVRSPPVAPMGLLPNVGLYKIDHFEFCAGLCCVRESGVAIFECDKCSYDETTLFKLGKAALAVNLRLVA